MCMASGTVVSGEGSGGGGGSGGGRGERERQRWAKGSKVYTRKSFKGSRNQTNGNSGSVFASINFVATNDSKGNGNTNTNNTEDPSNQNKVRDIPHKVSGTPNDANGISKDISGAAREIDEIRGQTSEIPGGSREIPGLITEIQKESAEAPGTDETQKEADEIQKEADEVRKESGETPKDNVEIHRENGENETHPEIHKVAAEQVPETLVLEEPIGQHQQIPHPVVVSDDSSSLNRSQHVLQLPSPRDPVTVTNGVGNQGAYRLEDKMKLNLSSRSKQEMRELRRKLENDLNTVRSLEKRMKIKEGQAVGGEFGHFVLNDNEDHGGARRVNSEVASVSVAPRELISRPSHQLSISVIENSHGMNEFMEKEKRTPKANQFYRNSEFLLAKDKFPPAESNKKSKTKSNGKKSSSSDYGFGTGSRVFKSCNSLIDRLMKNKHGWVFNSPVNPVALGLHDYFTIITHPMDLGTVKARLSKNWYKSPREFAEDVRLTFHNAMTYNPKGQDVHVMAEILLKIFEDKWIAIEAEYLRELKLAVDYDAGLPTPTSRRTPFPSSLYPTLDMRRILDRSESMTNPIDPRPKTLTYIPSVRTPVPKKPKAKDPNKRDMTYEEKQKLSTNLQSLPAEKLDGIVQIIKKRNSALSQHDDEIEVDIDSVDNETLWELDRYVTNYKKSLSKNKRKAELATQARGEAKQSVHEKIVAPASVEASKEAPSDHKTAPSSSPVKGSNQPETGSRSSSSSSSSSDSGSSSSDSDSDSSSDESDAGRSPAA